MDIFTLIDAEAVRRGWGSYSVAPLPVGLEFTGSNGSARIPGGVDSFVAIKEILIHGEYAAVPNPGTCQVKAAEQSTSFPAVWETSNYATNTYQLRQSVFGIYSGDITVNAVMGSGTNLKGAVQSFIVTKTPTK